MKRRVFVSVVLVLGILLVCSVLAAQVLQGQRRHVISEDSNSKITSNSQFIGDLRFGHSNSEIIVNVKGSIGTLDLLYDSLKTEQGGSSPANYTGHPLEGKQFVTANTIYITSDGEEKSLQKAIDDGDFYYASCESMGAVSVEGGCLFNVFGEYEFAIPTSDKINVTVVGAGGGRGTKDHSHWHCYGGAGGGATMKQFEGFSVGEKVSIVVGEGGQGINFWCNGCSGNEGGSSYFGNDLYATGGQGGYQNGKSNPMNPGMGFEGDLNCEGGQGKFTRYVEGNGGTAECEGGDGGIIDSDNDHSGDCGAGGGASPIGGDGNSEICGAGGGGAIDRSSSNKQDFKDGADGCVLITW